MGFAALLGLRDDASIVPYGRGARPCRGLKDTCGAKRQCTPPPALRAPPLAGEAFGGRLSRWVGSCRRLAGRCKHRPLRTLGRALPGFEGSPWVKAAMHPSVCALRRIHCPVCGARIARRALKHACALRPSNLLRLAFSAAGGARLRSPLQGRLLAGGFHPKGSPARGAVGASRLRGAAPCPANTFPGLAASLGLRDDASIVPYGRGARPCRGLKDTCGAKRQCTPPPALRAPPLAGEALQTVFTQKAPLQGELSAPAD